MDETQTAPRAGALATVLNTITSPKEAFENLRLAPTWGWAFVIALVLSVIGSILMMPALRHVMDAVFSAQAAVNPRLAQLSPDQLSRLRAMNGVFANLTPFVVIIATAFAFLVSTVIMLIFNAIGRGSGSFKTLWSAACNIGVPAAGIASVLLGIIVWLRGPESFSTQASLQHAMPSLALLVPSAGRLTNFLGAITPFSVWAAILVGVAMLVIARVPKLQAWLAGIVVLIVPALLAMASGK